VENGFTWLDQGSWGQGFNEDTKLVIVDHVFRELDFARIEWQCDAANERSAAALSRLGFPYEGTLRSRHVRPDGSRRDSLVFGLVVGDWPAVRERILASFEARVDPALLLP
jgi:RimJ/RimL family protein N-acetyltransferase